MRCAKSESRNLCAQFYGNHVIATQEQREVYRQRFETYRFHYRLEWQLFQAGVAIGLISLGLGNEAHKPQQWQFIISGVVFIVFSYAMLRLAVGIKKDRRSFIHYAGLVGDEYVREIGLWYSTPPYGVNYFSTFRMEYLLYAAFAESMLFPDGRKFS